MKYTIETLNDVVILDVRGPWFHDEEQYRIHEQVKERLQAGIEAGAKHVIVDLEHCRHVASGGIGILGAIKASTAQRGGRLLLCCVSDRVRTSLVVAGMWNLHEAYATRGEALRELATQPTTT